MHRKNYGKDGLAKSVKVLKSVGCLIKYSELNIKHRAAVHILKSMQQVLFHLSG